MIIKFKKLNDNAKLPTKGSEQAGALDVYASEIIKELDGYYIVNLGFATEIPEGYRMRISGRSGLTKTNWYIANTPGIIDADYRGMWQVRFRGVPTGIARGINDFGFEHLKLVYDEFPFQIGDRVAQIYLEGVSPLEFELTDELEDTKRGVGGYGSTGR
jgi:dUTP pyrophosphatase